MTAARAYTELIEDELQEGPPTGNDFLIAFLPLENLSGTRAPLKEIGAAYRGVLENHGLRFLDGDRLEAFRKKYRMRYVGGVSNKISEAMRDELQVDAILITSLEAYQERNPPQISIISRLVTSGYQPEIAWMDSVGLSGDQSPGLLDLTRVREPGHLLEKAAKELGDSLMRIITGGSGDSGSFFPGFPESWRAREPGTLTSPRYRLNRKYLPYDYFRSDIIEAEAEYSVAVIPMLNLAVRKNAGEITSLHYVKELFNRTNYKVVEPGLVREELLRFRAIMPAGPSLAIADLITSSGSLGVDLVLSGKVFDYQNRSDNPKADYSVHVIEKNSREVVFGARTFSTGLQGVFFFNMGRVFTAHKLLEEMVQVTVQLLHTPYPPWEPEEDFIARDATLPGERKHAGSGSLVIVEDKLSEDKIF